MAASLLVLLGDVALSAQQVSGVRAERELPVVWPYGRTRVASLASYLTCCLGVLTFIMHGPVNLG